MEIRSVTDDDCKLLWEWINEPGVRAQAFGTEAISWDEHVAWFQKKRIDPNCWMYLLTDEERRPIAQVRFDILPSGAAETAISVARDHRNRGYGTEALGLACETFRRTVRSEHIIAYIKPGNAASIRVFEKAGFVSRGRTRVKGQDAVFMTLDFNRQPTRGAE